MQHQEFEPPEELRDTIKCFWHNSADFGERQSRFEVVPDGYAELIFYFGSGCSLTLHNTLQPLPSPFLIGLLHHPVFFQTKNRLEIIGIRFYPWTVFDVLGLPSGKDGVRVLEHPIAQLQTPLEMCMQEGKLMEALAHVQHYFLNARKHVSSDRLLVKAGTAMRTANGTLPVSQVAAAAHATVRTLERKFKQSSGYAVRDVSGLMRFEQVRNHLWLHPNASLAGLAHELGYTDQAHLSREFKRYSGTSPAAFARKARREKPVVSSDFVAFVQA
ncbi:helix-turn-helix domain-containing protein [Larkinella rosea]|uniref:AraC family transcriptional regulator n=1 Tax=Larkinella rosea TaxID=2025312 RepID=A0A3P1C1I3_9BACT|nr:helix-turn-helix domain-containing protein [Larkinella rosea]RRB07137.1 AraC family transcriptional regulator [Larkinella rosea]